MTFRTMQPVGSPAHLSSAGTSSRTILAAGPALAGLNGTFKSLAHWTFCFTALLWNASAQALEGPNQSLPDGLLLHLDADRLAESRPQTDNGNGTQSKSNANPASKDAELETAPPVESWKDARGKSVDQQDLATRVAPELKASKPEFAPVLHSVEGKHFVRFDGVDDHLHWAGEPSNSKSLSLAFAIAPHSNEGGFRGFFALNENGKRDYQSGINIDFGLAPSSPITEINIEGAGFSGARNMLTEPLRLRELSFVQVVVDEETRQIRLYTNGKSAGVRPYNPAHLSLQSWTLGARFYSNNSDPQRPQGFFDGDIAEVAVWDRALAKTEVEDVFNYMLAKHSNLKDRIASVVATDELAVYKHVKAPNPPAVQMLLPGFEVLELPVVLTNVNNVLYRRDGTLVTLGYNGDVHLLRDSDGDGVEDKAAVFWKNTGSLRGPIGMIWTPEDYEHGQGVIVASKGKVSALLDTDGDDVADVERIISEGWNEIKQNVDAVGMALGKDGYLYFGLGTADYANPYQVDESGKSAFSLNSDRGTIQRVHLATGKRETFATGIRFPIGISFHPNGDLFCSDQEGATWLPNGNPFDELLFVEAGKHYGFPPRHPEHNPNVIDEPSVFDYGPQHQSTCGLWWNKEIEGQKLFGSDLWKDNALVMGESRGKIWRTQVIKTAHGYQAMTQLIAALQMLTIDSCVSPQGDLIVACHSGPPDWGTGPAGIGKLFRIRSQENAPARPVMAWAQSPTEFRIAFDKPLTEDAWRDLPRQISIEYGEYVRAGDHYENLVPPYAVVQQQLLVPKYSLPVIGVNITADRRTVLVQVPPTSKGTNYAVRWNLEDDESIEPTEASVYASASTLRSQESPPLKPIEIPQRRDYAVDINMGGVIATWMPTAGESRTVWLPHMDLQIAKELTKGSAEHEAFFEALQKDGTLTFDGQIDAYHWLRPQVQPGSKLTYEWPQETVTLQLVTNADIPESNVTSVSSPSKDADKNSTSVSLSTTSTSSFGAGEASGESTKAESSSISQANWTVTDASDPLRYRIRLATTDASKLTIELSASTNEDAKPRIVPLTRMLVPWAQKGDGASQMQLDNSKIAELQGGDWGRGRRVFHSGAAGCFKCHAINNIGPSIGPDLSNLIHRDYASVMRDLVNPSYSINPDYLGHLVRLDDGTVLTGVLRTEEGRLLLGDAQGVTHTLEKDHIEEIKPSQLSVMPTGLLDTLSEQEIRDLMTYLLTPPPSMPLESSMKAPPLRSKADVLKVLDNSAALPEQLDELKLVLVAGKKDHGRGEHDYPAWQVQWSRLLAGAAQVQIDVAQDFPSDEQLDAADVLIFFQKGAWNDMRAKKLDAYLNRGGGAIYIHWAVNGDERSPEFAQRIGLASRGGHIKYRHGPLKLDLHNTDHPILRNMDTLELLDESYWMLSGDPGKITLLATSTEENAAWPQIWCYEQGAGKVFVSIPGHYSWTFDDPYFRTIILRAIAWSANQPIDRFNELVLPGARVK